MPKPCNYSTCSSWDGSALLHSKKTTSFARDQKQLAMPVFGNSLRLTIIQLYLGKQ